MKRIIKQAGLALLCAFLLMGAAQAATITPSVTKVTLSENQTTFTVDVSLSQKEAFAGAEFGVDLPEGVTVTGVTFLDEAIQNASKSPQLTKNDRYFFGFYDTENQFSGSYQVARLTFSYSGSADVSITLGHSKIVTILDDASTSGDTSSAPFTIQVTRESSGGSGGGSTGGGGSSGGGSSSGGGTDIEEPDTPLGDLPYTDVDPDAWYAEAVAYAVEKGLMTGTSSTTFAPEATLTRAMMAQILYNLEGKPSLDNEVLGYPYADVDADAWYADAVYWARKAGLVSGYSEEKFGPNDPITREQLASILCRYAAYKGKDVSAKADLSTFTDASSASTWAVDSLKWAVSEGILSGKGNGRLDPTGTATRAEVAQMFRNYLEKTA